MFRINMPIDYGSFANATSLNLITKKLFKELGYIMNKTKSFTITATMLDANKIGDINQHFDCVSLPNMGGYMFPPEGVLSSNNLFVGLVGIDEVVLGKKVFRTQSLWQRSKPIIEREVKKWKENSNKIKHIHVSTVSDKMQVIEYLKIPEEKLSVIPYGVDHDLFKPPFDKEKARKKILSKFFMKDEPYFVHVSEINWKRKNILRLLEAFKKAKDEGLKHNLIIIGKNEPIVFEKAKENPAVKILGFLDEKDLVEIMQGSDALINPSLHEGFGFPLVEAMACEVPVISSNIFSPPEVVGEGGLFVEPDSVSDIRNKILEMAKNENLRMDLSKKALQQSKNFSWRFTARKLLELFEKYCGLTLDGNFDEQYDLAAIRTIVTATQIHPKLLKIALPDLKKYDLSRIIHWDLEIGFDDPIVGDYLKPFKNWLEDHSE